MGQCLSYVKPLVEEAAIEALHESFQQNSESHSPTGGASESGAIYSSLPSGAEQYKVRNVYDGDTLTLIDERRVRLLGIDTPEIKEQQPFAQEAKAYTKDRCDKREIWLSYEPGC